MNPFAVSSNGASVQTASGTQNLLRYNQPFTKLDTTKQQSFQTISLLFNHEPTQPSDAAPYIVTQVYQFAHGYTYIPTFWMTWQNPAPAFPGSAPSGGSATTFWAFGDETANEDVPTFGSATGLALLAQTEYNEDPTYGSTSVSCFMYVVADTTNITFYIAKSAFALSGIAPIFIIGITLNIRMYIFTEPANTSMY